MYTAGYFIDKLKMTPHPEGGYYKESYVGQDEISSKELSVDFQDLRKLWTSIYFLLEDGDVSHFHRLKSDEMWYYQAGAPLTIYMITPQGDLITQKLGLNIEEGERPQFLVPKGYIFGSSMNQTGYALVGCMVAPGFDFRDFELFKRNDLLKAYPQHQNEILKLTYED
jgi:predicted cupin superfamily sugar epimerase